MAQLKDLIVNGATRLIGDAYVNNIQITNLIAPTSAGGSTYGPGTQGQVLLSNNGSVYWGSAAPTVTESVVSGWGFTKNTGTITGATNNGGLKVTGTTLGHSNTVITAKTTQAFYPIAFDALGHITGSGTAITPLTASSSLNAAKLTGTVPTSCYTNTWTAMVGATSSANGSVGYVNATPPKDGYNTKYLRADGTWQVPPDTHHTAYLRAGASGGTANAATTTGNTYLNLVENGANRSGVKLVPSSNMTITSDANGNVTFTATNTTYSAGTGISLSGTEFSNSGVRATTINGNYLRVNTNGTNADLTIPYATSAGTANAVAWGNVSGKPSTSITWGAGTTNGPTLTVTAAGSSSSALAIPTASETASGIVTNGNQIFRGRKGFGYMSRYGKSDNGTAAQYIADTYLFNSAGTQVGEFWYDIGNATNITKGQYYFRQFSPNSTANTATTGKYETYTLPNVASGLTENKNYSILTSKSAVTVNQGGTGATTASNARKNLGTLGSKLANSYEGMTAMDGTDSVWIRTTTLGIIPYQSGEAGSGHSALGTTGWRFSTSYIDTMYGNTVNATPIVRSSDFGTNNPVTANKSGVAGQLYFMYVN